MGEIIGKKVMSGTMSSNGDVTVLFQVTSAISSMLIELDENVLDLRWSLQMSSLIGSSDRFGVAWLFLDFWLLLLWLLTLTESNIHLKKNYHDYRWIPDVEGVNINFLSC